MDQDVSNLLSFALTSAIIEITPGPNMTYLALVSASQGRRAGFVTVLGVAAGLGLIGTIAALGVAEAIAASTLLYETLRWGGILFLLYLAWDGWRGGGDVVRPARTDARHFRRGLLTNVFNPKAAAFYVTVLPTFVVSSQGLLSQTLVLTAIYVAIATAIHLGIVAAAGSLEPFLTDSRRERIARRVLSALLALVAVWFAW